MAFEPSEGLYAGLSFVPTADLNAAKNDVGKFKELYFVALENLKSDKVLDAAGNATKNGMIKIIDLDTSSKKPEDIYGDLAASISAVLGTRSKLKKDKIIVFIGKLNSAKGYNLFGPAVINILNKYKDWRAIVAGNEKRESYNFHHERFKVFDWLSHKQIINIYKKSSKFIENQWNASIPLMLVALLLLGFVFGRSTPRAGREGSLVTGVLIYILY